MYEEKIIRHCSPTLAGIKTGNIFSYKCESEDALKKSISFIDKRLKEKGIRVTSIGKNKNGILIYVYRPKMLTSDFKLCGVRKILCDYGYNPENVGQCIKRLSQNICKEGGFPHEIGVFLGYPSEDVRGFIENGAKEYKYSGYWKVYGDVPRAKKLFESYKKCTEAYIKRYEEGNNIEKLSVIL